MNGADDPDNGLDPALSPGDPLDEPDNPDEWRDVCDDETADPHAEEGDDG